MNNEIVLELLINVKNTQSVGATSIDVVNYAIINGLLIGTEIGNFKYQ